MNAARIAIVQFDRTSAPCVSRVMPAVLDSVVPEPSFIEFCDIIDRLLAVAAVDYMCRAKRNRYWVIGFAIWALWFYGFFMAFVFELFNPLPEGLLDAIFITSIVLCIIHMGSMWIWTTLPTGVRPSIDVLREIRAECEAMTNRTPHASFHIVLLPIAAVLRDKPIVNTIERIDVSVSAVGMELCKTATATAGSVIGDKTHKATTSGCMTGDVLHPTVNNNLTMTVTNDYHQLEVV